MWREIYFVLNTVAVQFSASLKNKGMNYLIQVKQTPSKVNQVLVEGSIFVKLTTFCFIRFLLLSKLHLQEENKENLRVSHFS